MLLKKLFYTFCLGLAIQLSVLAQEQNNFSIPPNVEVNHVDFKLIAPEGISYIYPSINPNILTIHTRLKKGELSPKFMTSLEEGIQKINFQIQNRASRSQNKGEDKMTISILYMGKQKKSEPNEKKDRCNIYLNKDYSYSLNLNYAHGESYIDLSELATKLVTLNAGNAHLKIDNHKMNRVEIDTFSVKIGAGTVLIDNMDLTRTAFFTSNIVYGNLDLKFNNQVKAKSRFEIKVGAGTLKVKIPEQNTPISIKMNTSAFSTVKIPTGFVEKGKNTFVNEAYQKELNTEKSMIFLLDVSVGEAIFYY